METIYESSQVLFQYDEEFKILKAKWTGQVTTEEFKHVIMTGARIIHNTEGFTSIILDRSELDEFSTESRVWLKQDFMRNDGRVLIKKVKKLAAIKPSTTFATVMTTVFSAIFQIANPNMEYKVFEKPDEAAEWITGGGVAKKNRFLSKIFNLFRPAEEVEQG